MRRIIPWSFIVLFFFACGEKDIQLEDDYRKKADSIYASKVDQIGHHMDSICLLQKDSLIQLKYDSIVRTRKQKIRELSQ